MKTLAIFLVCALAFVAADEWDHTNGEPGCQTQEEVSAAGWRNNWDNTRFWVCPGLNQRAQAVRCRDVMESDDGYLWLQSAQRCVIWYEWEWTFPSGPPSRPSN